MATIRFFTRTITKDKNTLVPIWVRLRSGREVDLSRKTGLLIKPINWSNETQQARQRADVFKFMAGDSKSEQKGRQNFNKKTEDLKTFIESELMQVQQSSISAEWFEVVVDKYWNPEKYKVTLYSYIESFIQKSETKPNPKTGRPVCYKMRREYQVSFNYLKEYSYTIKKEFDFQDINLEFYDGFIQFLQKRKLSVNTIGKKIQTLKIFLNAATDEGLNTNNSFKSKRFIATTEEADTIYLNESELQKIYETKLSDKKGLERVRDLFLVGCWTGCRFSDIPQITPESISGGFIHLKQHKTGTKVVIPLHSVVTTIINKYDGKLPKPISNQRFNEALKTIGELAGISERVTKTITKGGVKMTKSHEKHELITSHTARRSFATNLYNSGFPSISIMAITGHKTEEAFLKYIKVTPDEHAKGLQSHWDKRHLKIV